MFIRKASKEEDNFLSEMPSPRIVITKANSILYFYLRKANEKIWFRVITLKFQIFLFLFLFVCRLRVKKNSPGNLHALLLCLLPSCSLVMSRVVLIANEKRLTIIQIWLINFLTRVSTGWSRFLPKSRGERKKSLVKMSSFKMSFNMFNFSYHIPKHYRL